MQADARRARRSRTSRRPLFVDGEAPTAGHAAGPDPRAAADQHAAAEQDPEADAGPRSRADPEADADPEPDPEPPSPTATPPPTLPTGTPTDNGNGDGSGGGGRPAAGTGVSGLGPAARDTGRPSRSRARPGPTRSRAPMSEVDRRSGRRALPPAPVVDAGPGAARRLRAWCSRSAWCRSPVRADGLGQRRRPLRARCATPTSPTSTPAAGSPSSRWPYADNRRPLPR